MGTDADGRDAKRAREEKRDKNVQLLQENLNQEETTARRLEAGAKALEERVEEHA